MRASGLQENVFGNAIFCLLVHVRDHQQRNSVLRTTKMYEDQFHKRPCPGLSSQEMTNKSRDTLSNADICNKDVDYEFHKIVGITVELIQYWTTLIYSQLLFMMMTFRNAIQDGTKFYYLCTQCRHTFRAINLTRSKRIQGKSNRGAILRQPGRYYLQGACTRTSVNFTKQQRDVKQGIRVCSRIIRLMNNQTKSQRKATIHKKEEKAMTKKQWLL